MSLEAALAELNATMTTQNDLLRQVLAADAANGGDAAEKPKRNTTKKTETTEAGKAETKNDNKGSAVTLDGLKGALGKWLGEFAKEADKDNPEGVHPEVGARKAALKATLEKLGAKQLGDIKDDQEKLDKLWKWLHEKALTADKGFGVGRLAADPKEEDTSGDDDLEL